MLKLITHKQPGSLRKEWIFVILISILILFSGCGTPFAEPDHTACTRTRAAFDIGSSHTKLTVARVNTCENRLEEIYLNQERPVGYREALQETNTGTRPELPEHILRKGFKVLSDLKRKAGAFHPDGYSAIATSVFRDASNGRQAVRQLSRNTGIPIRRVSQRTEARLGLAGATRYTTADRDEPVAVWDIGAGSMQLTVRRTTGKLLHFHGELASIPFRRAVVALKGQDPDTVSSPNPLGPTTALFAYALAFSVAKRDVPSDVQAALEKVNEPMIGIGGVHVYSIRPQVARSTTCCFHSDIVHNLFIRSLWSDDQIGSEYAATEVSNLALVGGMMHGLGISRIRVADVNLTDGLLLIDAFWDA